MEAFRGSIVKVVTAPRPVGEGEGKEWPGIQHSNAQRQRTAGHMDLAPFLSCYRPLSSAGEEGAARRPSREQSRPRRQTTEG